MNRTLVVVFGSLAVLAALLFLIPASGPRPAPAPTATGTPAAEPATPLTILCAASNRAVMEAIQRDYEAEFGVRLDIQYGASQSLLSNLEISQVGDLYLPADDSYLELARQKKLVDEVVPVAEMHAAFAVSRKQPPAVQSLADVLQSELRVVQANPDAAAIGKLTRAALSAAGTWEALEKRTVSFKATVNEVATDVQVGAADVGIVFDAVLHTFADLQAVAAPELQGITAKIAVGVVSSSKQPQRALHFARYLSAPEKGQKRYAEFGFHPLPGDPWEDAPELTLYSGSMLRPAIEATLEDFERREGVRVTRVYNGCGILVGQMQAGKVPDAYFACDAEFMQQVRDLFAAPTEISQNELVILVPKGNPQKIATLKDLARPGLRVGVGHEKQCAMGWLTQRTFREGGVQTEVMQNVTVQTPTGDMLVNQMRAGSLDAAVAYLSNAAGSGDFLDAIRIRGLQCAVATQPFAVAHNSPHPRLAQRLLDRLTSSTSAQAFTQNGFVWKVGAPATAAPSSSADSSSP